MPEQSSWIGRSMRRVEDPKLISGRAGYIDDVGVPRLLHVAVLHSPHPHALIKSIDVSAARALPGVAAVITGAEAAELCEPITQPDEPHAWRCLAVDKVRYVGEAVVAVAAESRYVAEDACGLISVVYEELPPVVDAGEAASPSAPLLHEGLGSNVIYNRAFKFGPVDSTFAKADSIITDELRWHRMGGQPLETVGAIASYDPSTGQLTIQTNSRIVPHLKADFARALKVPSHKLDIQPVPAGGSFGSKHFAARVPTIAAIMSKALGRPVKYIEDRLENISTCDHHGTDCADHLELALSSDGTMLGFKRHSTDDYGAYLFNGVASHANAMSQSTGPYRIESLEYGIRAVLTNKCQQGSYRGFGAEVGNWMLERMVDLAAKRLGVDRVEIRRKNFIQSDQFPYKMPVGNLYDSGDYVAVLDKALEIAGYDALIKEQKRLRAEGRYIGIGIATCQLRSVPNSTEHWFLTDAAEGPSMLPESVTINVDVAGNIIVTLHVNSFWGTSPETMAVQMVAEELGVEPSRITVVYADSSQSLPAIGPGGSRLTAMLGGAVGGASTKIRVKAMQIAAELLEVASDDLEWTGDGVRVKGSPSRQKSLQEIAQTAYIFRHKLPPGMEAGLQASFAYDLPIMTMPAADRSDMGVFYPIVGHACHIPVVEVDVKTGGVKFLSYFVVQDSGTMVNPRSLEGQVIGGIAQGIASALLEEYVYDHDGQLRTTSYLDYLLPTAAEVPDITVAFLETPSPFTWHGVKGAGESGRMAAPAAVASAIDDALAPWGVRVREMPATPERLLTLIGAAGKPEVTGVG